MRRAGYRTDMAAEPGRGLGVENLWEGSTSDRNMMGLTLSGYQIAARLSSSQGHCGLSRDGGGLTSGTWHSHAKKGRRAERRRAKEMETPSPSHEVIGPK